jgi:hypothetical protein
MTGRAAVVVKHAMMATVNARGRMEFLFRSDGDERPVSVF